MNTNSSAKLFIPARAALGAAFLGASLLAIGTGAAQAQSASGSAVLNTHQISAGTSVKLKLLQGVNSGNAQVGDLVRAQTAADDSSGLPLGTTFLGRVTEASPATSKRAGVLSVQFGIPREGGYRAQNGYSSQSNSNQTFSDNNGNGPVMAFSDAASAHLTGQSASSDKSKYTTIGAGAGALLGFIRKRKLGDAIGGAVLGGAGGYAANAAQKHSGGDVNLLKGAEMTVHLNTPLVLRTEIVAPY